MSSERSGGGPEVTSSFDRFVLRSISFGERLVRAWRTLTAGRRLAVYTSFGLFVGLFLPWYSETVIATGSPASVQARNVSVTGWGAFSLVQAVVLLVAAGVPTLLFRRADGRALRLPGGDGGSILVAGGLTCLLIVWGIFDQPGASGPRQYTPASGVEWGIFVVLLVAVMLAYAGSRIRAEHEARAPISGTGGTAGTRSPRSPQPGPPSPVSAQTAAAKRSPGSQDEETKVSKRTAARRRPAYDQPTPVSNRNDPLDAPTRISKRRPAADETQESPTRVPEDPRRPGPPVDPEDPPTMKIPRPRRPAGPPDAGHGAEGWSTNEK